jgi:adenylate cyclase
MVPAHSENPALPGAPLAMTPHRTRLDGLGCWLAEAASQSGLEVLFPGFCRELVARGFAVWRGSMGLEVLHPEVSGSMYVWTDESADIRVTGRARVAQSASYLRSPTRVVDETNRTFRRRLDAPLPEWPLLEELREVGATDYVMFPLPFLDTTRTAVMSFAARRAQGFQDIDIAELETAARLFSPYAERHVLRRIAIDLLDTYVGPRTGRRIIEGQVERGEFETIEAAIWFADLRGFTRRTEETSLDEVLADLNAWFDAMVGVIDEHGGEVLKFIGDAALAIFPVGPQRSETGACADALAAAASFAERRDGLNGERRADGRPALVDGIALHLGEVAYGNVGAPRRLDFTVIGPAVNRASRLLELAKRLGQPVVVSDGFARALGRPLVPLGRHELRGVPEPMDVFAPDRSGALREA